MEAMKKPWQIHPDLLPERLSTVAGLIASVRSVCVDEHRPEAGDGAWGLGCRVYERTIRALANASGGHDWLEVVEWAGLQFVFAIGAVPFKFYRGEHDDTADPRRLRQSHPELYAQQRAFDFVPEPDVEPVLRIVVETNDDGRASSIFLVQLDSEGEPHNPWEIPFTAPVSVALDEFRKEGVELPAPAVGDEPRRDVAADEEADAEAK